MLNFNILEFDEVTSTNVILKEKAVCGEPEGTVVIAKKQTAGKGRCGRSFFSPENNGLYMSVLLRPDNSFEDSFFVTPMAAVSVCRALSRLGAKDTYIKWVNDIFLDGKKVCGILAEAGIDKNGHKFIVLGIGINLMNSEFPDEIKNIAGAVFEDKIVLPRTAAQKILDELWELYKNCMENDFYTEYKNRSFIIGKEVFLVNAEEKRRVKVLDIDKQYRLVIENEMGLVETIFTGEVSVRL